mmetsp:Transcript_15950/g.19155  ORF Transcript_15950/g.19155 Transcript_15950/m.19155 type:complete len:209 (-) Transcript_15950:900-1526(-)|eukprot:CAMPEP_0195315788 /NCGR_PEP_ID=MMETSP0708-20121125/3215_1 /TAXON_ID=33640 /ORGANISM="Asterionellopsis glacialis, Strain CCMP134" /LENGTH=208 /DNA_ID=CAMNT_0040381071 /DNA_START=102 /DNA_END=728 /DNA_ORIENTATION=-
MTANEGKKSSVVISPEAFVTMLMHAGTHGTTVVHGVLLGSISSTDNVIKVDEAVPICHEEPTKPLIDTALSLVKAASESAVVGWYTSPERLQDQQPGPAALRITSSLAAASSNSSEPALIVLQNESMSQLLRGYDPANLVLKALGKDFGQQWLDPVKVTVTKQGGATSAAREAYKQKIPVADLVDHFEGSSVDWLRNMPLNKCVEKHC